MRELNETGYMQNRLRMIVAMYLTFYLQIDWRFGELYFAQNLVDYDYCNNLGGWLWSAGWEVHSNEYYRTFAMASQMKRFDPDAEYVKKWVPELKSLPAQDLYDWSASYKKYPDVKYIKPLIADMDSARIAGIAMYRKAHGK
jgi:deoxyribodipyrimidine photo-lyase